MDRRGFSLLELVLVLSIIGIMAAIALPRYAGASRRYRIDSAARRIAADLVLAQQHAESTGSQVDVIFNPLQETYETPSLPHPHNNTLTYSIDLSEEPYRVDIVSATSNGGTTFVIDGFGAPVHGGSVTIELGSYQKLITLTQGTGKVTVQ